MSFIKFLLQSAVHILNLIQEILPHASALNLIGATLSFPNKALTSSNSAYQEYIEHKANTTSHHYTWIQSDHPYKPATVSNYRVLFPDSVKWMSLEFDPLCATAQPEDSLQLYVPATNSSKTVRICDIEDGDSPPLPYWPILHKFTSRQLIIIISK